jgi:hypothetical protein
MAKLFYVNWAALSRKSGLLRACSVLPQSIWIEGD